MMIPHRFRKVTFGPSPPLPGLENVEVRKHECFENARRVATWVAGVRYVEGVAWDVENVWYVVHAWNAIGDQHFDVTAERFGLSLSFGYVLLSLSREEVVNINGESEHQMGWRQTE